MINEIEVGDKVLVPHGDQRVWCVVTAMAGEELELVPVDPAAADIRSSRAAAVLQVRRLE